MTEDSSRDQRALYLRWRPQSFADVVGQQPVVRTLRNAVSRGTSAHGYLFCGPRGTGKTSLARILYKALNCLSSRNGDPCGTCASCLATDSGRAMDLIEIDAASNRGIDDIRSLRERARFAPTDARFKVYIVDEAHQLTQPAWDAFLKTLEEPPPNTVFVLATTAAHKVPQTIVSRCQRFDLGRIPQTQITEHLEVIARAEGFVLESGVAERVARLARGGMRDALSMLEQLAAFGTESISLEGARQVLGLVRGDALQAFVDALSLRDARRAFVLLEDIAQEGADLRQFLDEVLYYLRAALLTRVGAGNAVSSNLGPEEIVWVQGVAQLWSPGEIGEVLRQFGEINVAGLDERQLLTRLELATAWATRTGDSDATGGAAATISSEGLSLGRSGVPRAAEPLASPPPPVFVTTPPPTALVPPPFPEPEFARPVSGEPVPPSMSSVGIPRATDPQVETPAAAQAPARAPEAPPLPASSPAAAPPRPPSLATLQAIWPLVLDRFQGPLLAKMLLSQMAPTTLVDNVVTLQGPLDPLDLKRLENQHRTTVETLLDKEAGVDLKVRFSGGEPSTERAEVIAEVVKEEQSITDFAADLFGGHVIVVPDAE